MANLLNELAEVSDFLCGEDVRDQRLTSIVEDAIEELKRHKWIPVSERLPDEEEAVEIWLKYDKIVFTAYLHKEWWVVCGTWGEKEFAKHEVSHWRKQQPPQEG